ncbi:MAG: hypothetical protein ABIR79_17605, partial [Candidatus Binatia bacterium]
TADALSTAFLVLGREGAAEVLSHMADVGALFVDDGAADRLTLVGRQPLHFETTAERPQFSASADRRERRTW